MRAVCDRRAQAVLGPAVLGSLSAQLFRCTASPDPPIALRSSSQKPRQAVGQCGSGLPTVRSAGRHLGQRASADTAQCRLATARGHVLLRDEVGRQVRS